MALNIKNQRVCDLARQAAERSGQTQVAAIESALEAYLHQLLAETDIEQLQIRQTKLRKMEETVRKLHEDMAIIGWANPSFTEEDLYDPETGLPA